MKLTTIISTCLIGAFLGYHCDESDVEHLWSFFPFLVIVLKLISSSLLLIFVYFQDCLLRRPGLLNRLLRNPAVQKVYLSQGLLGMQVLGCAVRTPIVQDIVKMDKPHFLMDLGANWYAVSVQLVKFLTEIKMVACRLEYRRPQQRQIQHHQLLMNQHHRQVQYPNQRHMDRQHRQLINQPHYLLMNQRHYLLINQRHCRILNQHHHLLKNQRHMDRQHRQLIHQHLRQLIDQHQLICHHRSPRSVKIATSWEVVTLLYCIQ